MEFLNWKNILLEWVRKSVVCLLSCLALNSRTTLFSIFTKANRLEFFGRPYYSLNLAEIESFFNEFKTRVTSVDIASKSLDTFIKRNGFCLFIHCTNKINSPLIHRVLSGIPSKLQQGREI